MLNPVGSAKTPPPEERLLRLIRGQGREVAPTAGGGAASVAASPAPAGVRTQAWRVDGFVARWPLWVGAILGVALLVEVGLMLAQLARPLPHLELPARDASASAPVAVPQPAQTPVLAPYTLKPLFAASATAETAGTEATATRAPSARATELAARLNLLGIIAGEPPQAIIEDRQTQKSYFVTTGQSVVEGAVVRQIQENRVVLDLQGETIELGL